jgi:hypothetical protein
MQRVIRSFVISNSNDHYIPAWAYAVAMNNKARRQHHAVDLIPNKNRILGAIACVIFGTCESWIAPDRWLPGIERRSDLCR